MVRKCWVNFQCRGVQLSWIIVGQGPIAFAVGAGGGCLDFFFSSPGDGPKQTEILSQRAVKPKTTNQPTLIFTKIPFSCLGSIWKGKCEFSTRGDVFSSSCSGGMVSRSKLSFAY